MKAVEVSERAYASLIACGFSILLGTQKGKNMRFRRVSAHSIIFVIVVNLCGAGISTDFAKIRFRLAQKSSFERTKLEDSVEPPFKINGISVDGRGNLYFSFRNIIACLKPDSEIVRIISKP